MGSTVTASVSMTQNNCGPGAHLVDSPIAPSIWGGQSGGNTCHQVRLTTVTWPDGKTVSCTYDSRGSRAVVIPETGDCWYPCH
jgi:hypothetical protein